MLEPMLAAKVGHEVARRPPLNAQRADLYDEV